MNEQVGQVSASTRRKRTQKNNKASFYRNARNDTEYAVELGLVVGHCDRHCLPVRRTANKPKTVPKNNFKLGNRPLRGIKKQQETRYRRHRFYRLSAAPCAPGDGSEEDTEFPVTSRRGNVAPEITSEPKNTRAPSAPNHAAQLH